MNKVFCLIMLGCFLFFSCGYSYPKETLNDDVKKLIKKETGQDSNIFIAGNTLYLDLPMQDIVSLNQQAVADAINKLQSAVFAIIRVVLSSDAGIKFMGESAFDKDYNVAFQMFQNIDDIKSYFYQRISRSDYEQRQLIEMYGLDEAKEAVNDRHNITEEEYVSRLAISQINMSVRNNPFLGGLINSLQLKYVGADNGTVIIMSYYDNKNVRMEEILKNLLSETFNLNITKYKLFSIKSAKLISKEGNIIFNVSLI